MPGGYPIGDGSHGAERTPGAWSIDERKRDANDGGYDNNRPEYFSDTCPHHQSALAPRYVTQLDTEHREDEEHHKQTETKGAHKFGNRTMR